MGSPVYVTLVIEGARLRAAGEKQKQTTKKHTNKEESKTNQIKKQGKQTVPMRR